MGVSHPYIGTRIGRSNSQYRPLLAIDLDDVLFDCDDALRRIIHNEFDGESSYMQFVTKHPHLKNDIFRFLYGSYHCGCTAIRGAFSTLLQLASNYRMIVITGRSESKRKQTEEWLDANFPKLFSAVYFTNVFLGESEEVERKKSDICTDAGVDVLIDDSIEEAVEVSSSGIQVLLFDRPWNRSSIPTTVYRVKDWNHVLNKLSNRGEPK